MGSHRATKHQSYDAVFQPLCLELYDRFNAMKEPRVETELPKGQGAELKARFYTWRKLLQAYVAKNSMVASEEEIAFAQFSDLVRTQTVMLEEEKKMRLSFYIETPEEFLGAFGIKVDRMQLPPLRKRQKELNILAKEVEPEVKIDPERPVDAPFRF